MIASGGTGRRGTVPCPYCLEELDWDTLVPHSYDRRTRNWEPIEVPDSAPSARRAQLLEQAVVYCTNSTSEEPHTLPYEYGAHGRPIIIALVGRGASGKTHLLASMIKEIADGGLYELAGLSAVAVDPAVHEIFVKGCIEPLFAGDEVLPGTSENVRQFTDALRLTRGTSSRVVAFFDIAGENIPRLTVEKPFFRIADGLLFVVDPDQVGDRRALARGESAFETVLKMVADRAASVAAAIVLAKADQLRFEPPIDLWIRKPVSLDWEALREESRDVYAYLHSRRAGAWLQPYTTCGRVTLHAASATGCRQVQVGEKFIYPRPVTPHRVLGPLGALLVMTGVIPEPGEEKVGVW